MRRPNLILGLLLLGVAAAVGFYASQPNTPAPQGEALAATKSAQHARTVDPDDRPAQTRREPREPLSIEAPHSESPEISIRAQRIDADTRRRLEALTERLDLSPGQQRRIYPLLARSNPGFDESSTIRGAIIVGPPGRITKTTADDYIQGLLDPEQRLEQEIAAAQDDIWWTHVIAKLEKDLVDATSPANDTAAPPESPDVPASEEPRAEPQSHRGENLFDRMESEDP